MENINLFKRIKTTILGAARDPHDKGVFHKLSLVAFLAWVGLGSDGLSSSCYGPEEAFRALGPHTYLAIFVAIGTAITIMIISASYSQIIELFPTGGGGYLVASKLLSPTIGMISGSALIIDYILTVTLSIASGAAAIFSFLPPEWQQYRLSFSLGGVLLLLILNLRGIKEAVLPLVPVFIAFVLLHAAAILYGFFTHVNQSGMVVANASNELGKSFSQMGLVPVFWLIMKSYSMGAGTYTGIEAVSNGLPILREPRVQTAHKTMKYIAWSLSITMLGIMFLYLLFGAKPDEHKTLNAILFENMTNNWSPTIGKIFILATLLSEAMLLFIAAQTGFLDGPRVLSNMALDRWMPSQFANLSDRLVTKNGIMLMGIISFLLMILAKGNVSLLVVLYSINVFITFSLSQLGMVRHWWQKRKEVSHWRKKLGINAIGLILTTFILFSVVIIKFQEGGWITVIITGSVVFLALKIKKHYQKTFSLLKRLDLIIDSFDAEIYDITAAPGTEKRTPEVQTNAKTAAVLVNGYNGLGAHTLLSIFRLFPNTFKNFIFIQVGSVDAGTFKGVEEVEHLQKHILDETNKYVSYMMRSGYYAEAFTSLGTDLVDEIQKIALDVKEKFPETIFFGGQLVFPEETLATRMLHNYVVFAVQRKFYQSGFPLVILPIRV